MKLVRSLFPLALAALVVALATTALAQSAITPGARVAIVGDSNTEQRQYSKFMECYLLACSGAAGVKTVVVGSPGAVDTNFFRPGTKMGDRPSHEAYNDNLAHLRDIDKRLATEAKQRFADVHSAMSDAMKKANEVMGPKYDVCG